MWDLVFLFFSIIAFVISFVFAYKFKESNLKRGFIILGIELGFISISIIIKLLK